MGRLQFVYGVADVIKDREGIDEPAYCVGRLYPTLNEAKQWAESQPRGETGECRFEWRDSTDDESVLIFWRIPPPRYSPTQEWAVVKFELIVPREWLING